MKKYQEKCLQYQSFVLEDDIVAMLEAEAELATNDEVENPVAAHNFM